MPDGPKHIVGGIVRPMNDPAERRRRRRPRPPSPLPAPSPPPAPSLDPVTATWVWKDQAKGDITWTFTNNTSNQVSFILLRNTYYFGNAFFPVYANGSFGAQFASALAPLSGSSLPPLGVAGFPQPDGSSKYIACFIFTLAASSSWSMDEAGFTGGNTPSGISTHVVTERLNRDTCIYYDSAQVTQYDSQTGSSSAGYSPDPSVFNTVVMDAAADAPYVVLYPNDSITTELKFASIMAAADEPYQWWWGMSGDDVLQKLAAGNLQLRNIAAYVDLDNSLRFAVIMGPPTGQGWWWYWGLSGAEVEAKLAENNAQLTDISPYGAPDGSLLFAVIMVSASGQGWWWYWGQTSDQVFALLQQNNAVLTKVSPYWAPDGSFRFAIIMAPNVGQGWWWHWGLSGADVLAKLAENNAQLTDVSAYIDWADNSVRFAVIMKPQTGQAWWWWWGLDADGTTQKLSANNARPTVLTPYFGCG